MSNSRSKECHNAHCPPPDKRTAINYPPLQLKKRYTLSTSTIKKHYTTIHLYIKKNTTQPSTSTIKKLYTAIHL
jgi:hypothetical protein